MLGKSECAAKWYKCKVSAIRLFGFAVHFVMIFPYRCCGTKYTYKKVNLSFNRDLYRRPDQCPRALNMS